MEYFLNNRLGLRIVLHVDHTPRAKGSVFLLHGLAGSSEQIHIQAIRKGFHRASYQTVLIDATNSFGQSDGDLIHATPTTFSNDLEDAVAWAKLQPWFIAPYIVCGQSLGGLAAMHFASKHADLTGLVLVSSVVSGRIWLEHADKKILANWQSQGFVHKKSNSLAGKEGRISYALVEDLMRYDGLAFAEKTTVPTLIIVGSDDRSETPEMQKILSGHFKNATLKIIEGMPHNPKLARHLTALESEIKDWGKIALQDIGKQSGKKSGV